MNRIIRYCTILATLVAFSLLALPALAQADSSDAQVSIQVSNSMPTVGDTINYSYSISWKSTPQDYTFQVLQQQADGSYAAYSPLQTTSLAGDPAPGSTSGSGNFTVPDTSRYEFVVYYYAQGQTMFEDEASIVIRPSAAPVVTPPPTATPIPTSPPAPPVTTTGTVTPILAPPVVAPVVAPVTPKPVGTEKKPVKKAHKPVKKVAPKPVTKAKLSITKRAAHPVYKPGAVSKWTIKVKDVAKVTAKRVTMCDLIPSGMQFVSASRSTDFTGAKACFTLGNLRPGKTAVTTIKLTIDANTTKTHITNPALAQAQNASEVHAHATIRVPKTPTPRSPAPVTG